MNKIKTIIAITVLLGGFVIGISGQSQPASAISGQQWEIQANFTDEFEGSEIDWQNKWSKTSSLPNVSAWKWDNTNNATLNDGVVELTMRHNANNVSDGGTFFKSGIIQSQTKTCYGYFEARIKGSSIPETSNPSTYKYDWYGRGCCPAFWLWGFDESQPIHSGKAVRYSEIDVVEIQQFDYYQNKQYRIKDLDLNLHTIVDGNWVRPKNDPENQKSHFEMSEDPTAGYHTYGVENRPDSIFWYLDGERVAAKKNRYWHLDMNVTVSLGIRVPFVKFQNNAWAVVNPLNDARAKAKLDALYDETVNPDAAGTTKMHLDYIRTWKAMPSLWFDVENSYDNSENLEANIGFQPGTGYSLSSEMQCHLLEKDESGNVIKTLVTVKDQNVIGLYGGNSKISMPISNVTPSSELPGNHYYVLQATFTNSNGEAIAATSDVITINGTSTNVDHISSFPYEVYPNPATDMLYIKGKANRSEPCNISIYQITGQLVLHNNQCNAVNISGLAAGMYIIKVNGKTSRFIKNQL